MISTMDHFIPFQFKIHRMDSLETNKKNDNKNTTTSTWVIAPYFMIYFILFVVNVLVWPLLVMEKFCVAEYGIDKQPSANRFLTNSTTSSCVRLNLINTNSSDASKNILNDNITTSTLNLLIVGSVTSAILSLVGYFVIWKPTLSNCKGLAVFLPPVCILCQCVLYSYALTLTSITSFKYVVLAGFVLPSLHCNFQGVFLLYFHITNANDQCNIKQKREIVNTRIDLTHGLVFSAFIIGGFMIGFCFEFSYSLLFAIQFTLTLVNILYSVLLTPINVNCLGSKENNKRTGKDDTETSEEELDDLLIANASQSKNKGFMSKEGNLFSESPMIFSESSYRKELIVIMELTILTVAVISDANLSGTYLLQEPFKLSLREYGYCVGAQGVAKTIGLLVTKIFIYFFPLKHSTLLSIAVFNYVIYYIVLAIIPSRDYVYISLIMNFFGGLAIPTLISFMKMNFRKTLNAVLEISTISSLIVTVGFSSIQYVVYMKTRYIFVGATFLITAGILVLGFIVVLATFFSTTVKNRRRTKDYADRLLNDYQ